MTNPTANTGDTTRLEYRPPTPWTSASINPPNRTEVVVIVETSDGEQFPTTGFWNGDWYYYSYNQDDDTYYSNTEAMLTAIRWMPIPGEN